MAYVESKITNLGQLKLLAQRTKAELEALDSSVEALEGRLDDLEEVEAEKNVIVGVQVNGTDLAVDANRKVNVTVPTKTSDLTNDSNWVDEQSIEDKISAAVSGALIPSGSIAFADLPALAKANLNKIYNITDGFTTTADFVEGAGKAYPAGTNVAIINVGTEDAPTYKYDAYTGTFDFSGFATKVTGATQGNLAGLDANGNLTDSGVAAATVMTKIVGAGNGHVVTVNADGEAQDGGVALADLVQGAIATDAEVTEMITEVFGAQA